MPGLRPGSDPGSWSSGELARCVGDVTGSLPRTATFSLAARAVLELCAFYANPLWATAGILGAAENLRSPLAHGEK